MYEAVCQYTDFLIEISTAIQAAESSRQYTGLCVEVTRAEMCFLIANFRETDDSVSVEQFTSSGECNHTICVVGRSSTSDKHNSSDWGNAIACDFTHATKEYPISSCVDRYPSGAFALRSDWHDGGISGEVLIWW